MKKESDLWYGKRYYSVDAYLKNVYGCKMYRIALNAGLSCPNRDGSLDKRGCIFCSEGGSGDFAGDPDKSISEQISDGIRLLRKKTACTDFIAYFQAYTGTYGPYEKLSRLYHEAVADPRIRIIDIATRPDCMDDQILSLLCEINKIKPVWIELGLQTIHERSAAFIRRSYPLSVYEECVKKLQSAGIYVITHLILGLPGETKEDMLASVDFVAHSSVKGIKLSMLHVLRGTDLGRIYEEHPFPVFSLEEYALFICQCLAHLPSDLIVHRITGDGPKKLLLAPLWSGDKKRVLNTISHTLKELDLKQGDQYAEE